VADGQPENIMSVRTLSGGECIKIESGIMERI